MFTKEIKNLWEKLPNVFLVERFPEYGRVYDSLGEFLFKLDDKDDLKDSRQLSSLEGLGALENYGKEELNGLSVRRYMKT